MKLLLVLYLTLITNSAFAETFTLKGNWFNPDEDSKIIRFIKVGDNFHFAGKETFVFPDGELSHTIDQTLKIKDQNSKSLKGSVDVFDSRGCSFKGLAIKGEFQSAREVSFLITYPRYKVLTISSGTPSYRPGYCTNPHGYEYICGREAVYPYSRQECKLLEYVETPVTLRRHRN